MALYGHGVALGRVNELAEVVLCFARRECQVGVHMSIIANWAILSIDCPRIIAFCLWDASIRTIRRMKTTISFTSTISPELIAWVDTRARAQKRTRRAVLEEALRRYQRDATRSTLKEGFERAALDAGMLKLV